MTAALDRLPGWDVRYALEPGALAQGLGLAVGFGLVGSLYAVTRAVRMRPSDAMRDR